MPEPVSPRVLVAEDNEDAGITLKLLLEALGHAVFLVSDGAAAVKAAATFRPEIIILDIADRSKAKRAGIDHHLMKPLQLPALLAIFDSLPRPRKRK